MWVWKATTCFIYIAVYLLIMADIANKNKCIFCLICEGKESTKLVYEDDNYVAFSDIKPASKYHYLIIPKQHISDAKSLVPEQKTLVEDLVRIAKQILEQTGVDLSDVRFGFHWPPFHSISHLHLHAIAPASQMGFISRGIFKPDSWWFVTPEYVLSRLSKL